MNKPALLAVGQRLESAVRALSTTPLSPQEVYDLYEMVAIQILDSEFQDYPEGVLEAYLLGYLAGLPLPQ